MEYTKYVTGIQHIGIPTVKFEESIEFYEGLGFEIRFMAPDRSVVFMELKGVMLEIWKEDQAPGKFGAIDHISFDVTDVEAIYEEIKAAGYEITTDEIGQLPFWDNGVRFFTIVGPNKEKIEFCQKL